MAFLWSDVQVLYNRKWITNPFEGGAPRAPLQLRNGTYSLSDRTPPGAADGDWMTLSARTQDGLNLMLWVSLADVHAGMSASNRVLLWTGGVTLILGTALAVWLARSMTKPVRRLSAMAKRMANMDFSDRYVGEGQDELAELGQSLNTVSATMEDSLSKLKTANLRLQNDVEAQAKQNEAHTRFIRNVSHELKTPLALIQSYAEGLSENAADNAESRAYYCEVIEDEAAKLTQMLSKLTMLMQLESGGEELLIDRFDITELLKRLLTRYTPLFGEKGVAIPMLPEEAISAWGDAVLIENVAINYLTNALNHVAEGGEIRLSAKQTENGTVRVEVFNTGAPIPEEDLPHIWESFYKVDKARTRAYGGTGIGLSVVAAIMNAHAMPFGATNTEDGVTFWFELSTR